MDADAWWALAAASRAAHAAARAADPGGAAARRARALAALDTWLALRARAGDNVEQRSPAWYARRGFTVGGSQLGALAGVGSWGKTPWSVAVSTAVARGWEHPDADQRQKYQRREHIPAAMWGTALEEFSVLLLRALGATVREAGALWGAVPGHSNSPDGVAWLDPAALGRYLVTESDAAGRWRPAAQPPPAGLHLLEFKSYYSQQLGKPPSAEHREQVYGGLDTVPHARAGLLLNTVSRRCGFDQWRAEPGYNPQPTGRRPREDYPPQSAEPEALGLIAFHFGPLGGPGLAPPPGEWPRGRGPTGYPPLSPGTTTPTGADLFHFLGAQQAAPSEAQCYTAARLRLMWLRAQGAGAPLDLGTADPGLVNEVFWMAEKGLLWARHALVLATDPRDPAGARRAPVRALAKAVARVEFHSGSTVAVLPVKILGVEAHYFARPTAAQWDGAPRAEAMRRRVWAALEAADSLVSGGDEGDAESAFSAALAGERAPPPPLALANCFGRGPA